MKKSRRGGKQSVAHNLRHLFACAYYRASWDIVRLAGYEVYPMSRTILKFRGVERHPICYSTSAFTRREDRATLGSDLSALRGLAKGAGFIQVNPLLLPLENKSDKPWGLGQSPSGR